ncbi:uncharacterized protein [Solanum tuberosum]|uniref:uncharacterized protein n=1 Tax=Solanum tuberosum TaxID=4113 RepID=UPI00073A06AA|nr:PREDICTED: uncharacterized protein LOC107060539 [Solanum tuberosum]
MNSVSKSLLSGIAFATTAFDVWNDLKERFDRVDGSRTYSLHKDITSLQQGTASVSVYYTRLKTLWDEFEALVPPPCCNCDKSRGFVVHLNRQKLYQFFMGLNESYHQARSQILLMDPLPNINQAYAMIVGDESQKAVVTSTGGMGMSAVGMESLSLYSKVGNSSGVSQRFKRNSLLVCEFCKCKGHSKEFCYKVIGYPPDFKSKRKVQSGSSATRTSDSYPGSLPAQANFSYGLTNNAHMPDLGHTCDPVSTNRYAGSVMSATGSGASAVPHYTTVASHAEKEVQQLLQGCTFTKDQYDHILQMFQNKPERTTSDGNVAHTADHMVSNLDMLTKETVSKLEVPRTVSLPNGDVTQELFSGRVKEVGKEDGGLYVLLSQLNNYKKDSLCAGSKLDSALQESTLELWHKRLGHVSSVGLSKMFAMTKQSLCNISKCLVCPYAKQTRSVFPSSCIKSTACFDLVHIDLWGPYNTPTVDGNRYFLTIVDDFSRMTWLFLLQFKSDVCVSLKVFLQYVKTQFGKSVKVLRPDNGTEFVNSVCAQLFKDLGIIHQRSCPYTPQQNGVAEMKHRHLLEVTRALRFQAKIPLKYWGHCVLAAAYVINRLPSSVLQFQTPYEKLYGSPPVLTHLRTIGCLCFAKVLNEHDKLLPRSRSAIHMGYSDVQKGYLLLDFHSNSFFTSRDVLFREDIFPFAQMDTSVPPPIFVDSLQNNPELSVQIDHFPPVLQKADNMVNVCEPSHTESNLFPSVGEEGVSSQRPDPDDSHTAVLGSDNLEFAVLIGTRRSTRVKHSPPWLKDFVSLSATKGVKFPLSDYMSYSHLSPHYQCYIAATSFIRELTTYFEAITDQRWIDAMKAEIQALESNQTWQITDLPLGKGLLAANGFTRLNISPEGNRQVQGKVGCKG